MSSLETFNQYRPLLFSIAYRMLGTVADAEDIVQEAYLRRQSASPDEVRSPKAFLSTVATRLCIDQLKSARAQREVYVGPWLPEPVLTGEMPDMTRTVELAESISFAFLLLLESLAPIERAVFLLKEVFDYSYPEIAAIVGKSEDNCRQMVHRAKQHMKEKRPRFQVTREEQEQVTKRFIEVCQGGDMQGLLSLLAPDATLAADGGGKVLAARNILYGASNVARFMFGILAKLPPDADLRVDIIDVNGQPGIVGYINGKPDSVMTLDISEGQIVGVNIVVNPDKLNALT